MKAIYVVCFTLIFGVYHFARGQSKFTLMCDSVDCLSSGLHAMSLTI